METIYSTELEKRMNFHGYIYIDGLFAKPHDNMMTVTQAIEWLNNLSKD